MVYTECKNNKKFLGFFYPLLNAMYQFSMDSWHSVITHTRIRASRSKLILENQNLISKSMSFNNLF